MAAGTASVYRAILSASVAPAAGERVASAEARR
jgi:hypothetical protein